MLMIGIGGRCLPVSRLVHLNQENEIGKLQGIYRGLVKQFDSRFLGGILRPFESVQFALITCLDSSFNVYSLLDRSPALRPLKNEAKSLGEGLLVPTKRILNVEREHPIFYGFDEVWFFRDAPSHPKPRSITLVGPERIDQKKLAVVVPWLMSNSCSLALGDGVGLNLIAKVQGLVRYLVEHSADQPALSQ
jgi:hypothetical protein